MNRALRNELSTLAGLASAALANTKYKKTALSFGALALGLRFWPNKSYFNFRSTSVVITGGSRGLGLALAEQFLNEGAVVSLLARDHDELLRAQTLLKQRTGLVANIAVCDITDNEQLKLAISQLIKQVGDIDIWVNNAGSVMAAPLEAMESLDYEDLMNVHFFATQKACELITPYFKGRKSGHIVNISSIGGKIPIPHLAPYCASKFALSGYSQTAAIELAQYGIQVTTVHPGLMRTGSPVQGFFKGDPEKEYAWFALSDNLPGLSIAVASAAKQIVEAVRHGYSELTISPPAKIAALTHSLFPEIFTSLSRLANRFLPHNLSKQRHSGRESKEWIESKLSPLKMFQDQLRSEYNQGPAISPRGLQDPQ